MWSPDGYGGYNYVYQYKDHLGNVRLSYADLDNNGVVNASTEILEENNYYMFGLKHQGYNNNVVSGNIALKYKYNGKELNDELGLDWYDYGARNYQPDLGRWMNLDPLAAHYLSHSPYHYSFNNPIRFIDPDGRRIVDRNGNEVKVTVNTDEDGNRTASYEFAKGTKKSTIRNFKRNAGKVIGAMIGSDKGLDLVNEAIESKDNISINLSSKVKTDRLGDTSIKVTRLNAQTGEEGPSDIEVNVYSGSIDTLTSLGASTNEETAITDEKTNKILDSWKSNNLTRKQKIGSVGGHELYHAAVEKGRSNSEEGAENAEEVIAKEFGIQNKKKKE